MAVDWGFAGQVGGIGFGLVFAVLVILAVVIWLVGLVLTKIGAGKGEAEEKKEEERRLEIGTGERRVPHNGQDNQREC
ncbi:MAG: OadG family protein [Dehalococcoidales bacterium]|nr:OadG family protein [Dehalococcoidales bacterium]